MSHLRSPLLHHTIHRSRPDADWVVLVHGAGVTSEIWPDQIEAYGEEFNLLLPDLRGHGRSARPERGRRAGGGDESSRGEPSRGEPSRGEPSRGEPSRDGVVPYTFEAVSRDVLDLMDHHGIRTAHLVGISMGCLVARCIAELAPERVRSMVLAGAIAHLSVTARVLIALAHVLKHVVPHMWLYRFYAWILLPRREHLESRRIVVGQARALTRSEFLRWLALTRELPDLLRRFESHDPGIPTLYVMGDEDHMFLAGARAVAAKHRHARIHVFEDCGHVCSLQRPEAFNEVSLEFLRGD